jgi:CheY-like chemotaxis protein
MLLIVEDNETLLLYMRTLTARLGWKAITAKSGEQALQQYAMHENEIDIVFMDWNLSGRVDGLACAAEIHQYNPSLPIVGITAHATEEHRQRCLASGMSDFLSKPFTCNEMETMIARWQSSGAKPIEASSNILIAAAES